MPRDLPATGGLDGVRIAKATITTKSSRVAAKAAITIGRLVKAAATGAVIDMRVRALGLPMALLLAVGANNASHYRRVISATYSQRRRTGNGLTVTRLCALLAHVAELIAVAALDVRRVARLGALTRVVALLAAVTATTRSCRAVLGEMANCKLSAWE